MAPSRTPTSTVMVVGGDVIIGQILELLLRSADCSVRFLPEPYLDEPGVFDRIQLLVLTPGLGSERRESLLKLVESRAVGELLPVLELVTSTREAQDRPAHQVMLWPCRTEHLKQRIDAALLDGSGVGQKARDLYTT